MTATYEQRRDLFRNAQRSIYSALAAATVKRSGREIEDWILDEQYVVRRAANVFAQAHRLPGRVTLDDVRRAEGRALGHSDYAHKFALYVAEELFR